MSVTNCARHSRSSKATLKHCWTAPLTTRKWLRSFWRPLIETRRGKSCSARTYCPFQNTNPAEPGGTGLGLSIVKHIVQSHGGRAWARSEVGHGATFYMTLPEDKTELAQTVV